MSARASGPRLDELAARGRCGCGRRARSGRARAAAARRARRRGSARTPAAGTIRFTCACSSSSSMKTTPFAVDGRCRATTMPGDRDASRRAAARAARRSTAFPAAGAAASARAGARRPRGSSSGSRRASAPTPSARAGPASRPSARAAARAASPRRRSPARVCGARHEPELPEQLAPLQPEAVARARLDERGAARPADSARAARGRGSRVTAVRVALVDDASASSSPTPWTYFSPTRTAPSSIVQPAPLQVHVGRPRLDAAPLRVAHERRRRIEAHRLRVEQRGEELRRVVVAQPRRLVREQPERGRVRLREAEAREADELVVDHVRGRLVDALPERALDEARRGTPRARRCERLRLIARRSPSASPTVKPARWIATSSTWSWKTTTPSVSRSGSSQQRMVGRRHDSPGPRAASAAARCTGAPPCPGSAPAGRARPAP